MNKSKLIVIAIAGVVLTLAGYTGLLFSFIWVVSEIWASVSANHPFNWWGVAAFLGSAVLLAFCAVLTRIVKKMKERETHEDILNLLKSLKNEHVS